MFLVFESELVTLSSRTAKQKNFLKIFKEKVQRRHIVTLFTELLW